MDRAGGGLAGPRAGARPSLQARAPGLSRAAGGLAGPRAGARPSLQARAPACPRPRGGLPGPRAGARPRPGPRGRSPQAFPRGGWLDEGGSQARARAGPHCPCLSRAPGSGAVASRELAPAATGLFLAGGWQGPARQAAGLRRAQGPRHFSPAHYSALLQQASTPARAPPGPGNSRPSLREAVLLEGLGGTNRSDMGLNLSGSWQQGHSATYNTPSRI